MSKPVFKVQTLSVCVSTTLVLLLLGIMSTLLVAGKEVTTSIQESMQVSVIVNHGVEENEVLALKEKIEKNGYTRKVDYISAEQALKEEMAELEINPVEQLGYNPYEASLEITLNPEYNNADSIEKIEKELLRNSDITEVLYPEDIMGDINEGIRKAGIAMFILLVMLTFISWSQISNLVRLSIYSKRFLLHTMKLTGATWGFIRRPFIAKNIIIGLISGIAADSILAILLYALGQSEPEIMAYLPIGKLVVIGVTVILLGMLICGICAFLSVNRFLRMRNNDLYYI